MLVPRKFLPVIQQGKFRIDVFIGEKLIESFEGNNVLDKVIGYLTPSNPQLVTALNEKFAGRLIKTSKDIPAKEKGKDRVEFEEVTEEELIKEIMLVSPYRPKGNI